MPETTAIGTVSLRVAGFVVVGIALSTSMFSVISTVALFRDSAIPALFEVASSIPVGVNSYLALSYVLGFLVSYAFFYQGGFDRLRGYVRDE